MNPLENQSSPPRPPGAAQGNPLAQLAGQLPGLPPPMPAPTAAQATARLPTKQRTFPAQNRRREQSRP